MSGEDGWVFAYGSLMWNPGFRYVEVHRARLYGYHRSLCVWSFLYRGTPQVPGLVLGLDRGGSCLGRAYRVRAEDKEEVTAYLFERELVTDVYLPVAREARLDDGRRVPVLTFVVDRSHRQYAGRLSPDYAAMVVRRARGKVGPNREYVANTLADLRRLGTSCRKLHEVHRRMDREDD